MLNFFNTNKIFSKIELTKPKHKVRKASSIAKGAFKCGDKKRYNCLNLKKKVDISPKFLVNSYSNKKNVKKVYRSFLKRLNTFILKNNKELKLASSNHFLSFDNLFTFNSRIKTFYLHKHFLFLKQHSKIGFWFSQNNRKKLIRGLFLFSYLRKVSKFSKKKIRLLTKFSDTKQKINISCTSFWSKKWNRIPSLDWSRHYFQLQGKNTKSSFLKKKNSYYLFKTSYDFLQERKNIKELKSKRAFKKSVEFNRRRVTPQFRKLDYKKGSFRFRFLNKQEFKLKLGSFSKAPGFPTKWKSESFYSYFLKESPIFNSSLTLFVKGFFKKYKSNSFFSKQELSFFFDSLSLLSSKISFLFTKSSFKFVMFSSSYKKGDSIISKQKQEKKKWAFPSKFPVFRTYPKKINSVLMLEATTGMLSYGQDFSYLLKPSRFIPGRGKRLLYYYPIKFISRRKRSLQIVHSFLVWYSKIFKLSFFNRKEKNITLFINKFLGYKLRSVEKKTKVLRTQRFFFFKYKKRFNSNLANYMSNIKEINFRIKHVTLLNRLMASSTKAIFTLPGHFPKFFISFLYIHH